MNKDFKVMVMKERLERWRIWANWRARPNLGYGNVSAALLGGGKVTVIGAVEVEEASATDQAVAVLPAELKQAVKLYFLGRLPVVDCAKRMHCSRPTVYNRIDEACARLYDAIYQHADYAETRAVA